MKPFYAQLSLGLLIMAIQAPLMAQVQNETCTKLPRVFLASENANTTATKIHLSECDQAHGEIVLALPRGKNLSFDLSAVNRSNNVTVMIENESESLATYAVSEGRLLMRTNVQYKSLNTFELENKRRHRLLQQHSQQLNLVKLDLNNFSISPILYQNLLIDKTRMNENSLPLRYIELRPASLGLSLGFKDKSGPRAELSGAIGPGFYVQKVINSDDPNKIKMSPTPGVNLKLTIRIGK